MSVTPRCKVCTSTVKPLRCEACKVMFYCSRQHQIADRADHKKACKFVKQCRDNIVALETEMSAFQPNRPGQYILQDKLKRKDKQDTILSEYDSLVKKILIIKSSTAVETALNHCMDVLPRFRINHMDLKYIVPALLLRLKKDQKCYDFVKWYATTGRTYDWDNINQPYLDVVNASILEPVDVFINKFARLAHLAVVTLLKIRILQNKRIIRGDKKDLLIKTIESQLEQLYVAVKNANKYFWPGLLNAESYLAATPTSIYIDKSEDGSEEQGILAVKIYHDAWIETPTAIEVITKLVQKDAPK